MGEDHEFIVRPGEGRPIRATTSTALVKVDPASGRSFAIAESAPPAGSTGPPRHIHGDYDEAWYVLAGQMDFSIGDRTELCPAGSVAFAPRGIAHSFRNPGPQDARVLIIATPGALTEIEEVVSAAAAGDRTGLAEIMRRHRSWLAD